MERNFVDWSKFSPCCILTLADVVYQSESLDFVAEVKSRFEDEIWKFAADAALIEGRIEVTPEDVRKVLGHAFVRVLNPPKE